MEIELANITRLLMYLIQAASVPLSADQTYADLKMKKYKTTCERRNLNYIPICGECTGGWTETS